MKKWQEKKLDMADILRGVTKMGIIRNERNRYTTKVGEKS